MFDILLWIIVFGAAVMSVFIILVIFACLLGSIDWYREQRKMEKYLREARENNK